MAFVGRPGKLAWIFAKKSSWSGASAGIGRACAEAFAAAGARLILTARSRERLEETARRCGAAETHILPADLTDMQAIGALAEEVRQRLGRVDILVNNAGVGLYIPSRESEPEAVRRLFELNVFAPVELTRKLLPLLIPGSCIVNVSSIAGKVPFPWMPLYSASKYALSAYSDALRMELDGTGIHVLAVHPGYVATEFGHNTIAGEIPPNVGGRQRFGLTPEQCAAAILKGVRKGKRTVVTPRAGWAMVAAARLVPGLLYKRLAAMNPLGRTQRPD